ncbi:hypothetical protein [Nonomuraea sp. NPDC050202]|jgi:hypothetical protein|uniref:hypothetical protein n=1 Tax=Nonomuraea sp. NPDC050202 TaxID=3155035 RepID=UPI00340A95AA
MGEKKLFYRHDVQGRVWLIDDDHSRQVMDAFPDPLACAIVHELNEAAWAGRCNGGTSAYYAEDDRVYAKHGPHEDRWQLVPVLDLTAEQAQAFAHELHQAGQMGAYT